MARIIICGYMIRFPVIGMMFADFNFILGLKRLGHDVHYLEDSGWSNSCYSPATGQHSDNPEAGLQAVAELLATFQLDVTVTYVRQSDKRVWGNSWDTLIHQIKESDLVLNLGGNCWLDQFAEARNLVLIDKDPFFSQAGHFGYDHIDQYNVLFTYGTNVGQADCRIPTLDREWQTIFPPVVPDVWLREFQDIERRLENMCFSTIANWQAYGSIKFEGETYGQKAEEFLRFVDLPRLSGVKLEIATDNMSEEDRNRFVEADWKISSGANVSVSLQVYRDYILNSAGEFSVAKNAYVKSKSGWISDRSVCYLASGLPVVVQETGASKYIEYDGGMLTFTNLDSACACLDNVLTNYQYHCRAAIELTSRCFDYRVVLPEMLEKALQ